MKVACGTETGEAPAWQGTTRVNSGPMRPRSNAARRDASPVECRGTFTTGSLGFLKDRDQSAGVFRGNEAVSDIAQ